MLQIASQNLRNSMEALFVKKHFKLESIKILAVAVAA